MKKAIIILCFLMMGYFLFSQQAFKEASLVVNVEVPVRVFDGRFRNIEVKVKDKDYRIIHRAGNFAN